MIIDSKLYVEHIIGLENFSRYDLEYVCSLTNEDSDMLLTLTESNMKSYYESCGWGWDSKKKLEEFIHEDSQFVISRASDGRSINGFLMWRILEMEDEDGMELYLWEIQLEERFRGIGLGSAFMNILDAVAEYVEVVQVTLTVMKDNKKAREFFKRKGFVVDKEDPSYYGMEAGYYIISKQIDNSTCH